MSAYLDMLEAVKNYYGSGSDQWVEIAKYGITADNAESILSQVPGVQLIKNSNGSIRSYTYNAVSSITSGSSIAEEFNSNLQSGTASIVNNTKIKIPSNMGVNETGKLTLKSGMATAGNFVMKEVVPAVAATGLGISLGKTISKVAYDAGFNWLSWAGVDLESLNPETWGSITSEDDSTGAKLFNMVFGIDPETGTTQAYLDENAAAYIALYMQNVGLFAKTTEYAYKNDQTGFTYPGAYGHINISKECKANGDTIAYFISGGENAYFFTNRFIQSDGSISYAFYAVSNGTPATIWFQGSTYNFTGTYGNFYSWPYSPSYLYPIPSEITNGTIGADGSDIIKIIWGGERGESGGVPGTGNQIGAILPNLSNATTPEQALQLLKQQYPDMFVNPVTQTVVQPDGTIKEYHYIPINMPEGTSAIDINPVTGNGIQGDTKVNPDTSTQTLIDLITSIITTPPTNTDIPDTGSGDTPTAVIPSGSASALYSIYNPTQEELNNFGSWLWSANFVDQLLKMFNDPMQSIIGLHKVFAQPIISGRGNIKVGYLDSGINTNLVSNQYVTIDCGSVSIKEYFGNVFDYYPYTKIQLYLPFIGIVDLDTSDTMRSTLNIKYHIDVLTGACLAEIKITRDSHGGILYTYNGNCAVQYPLSSGSYMGIVTGIISAGIGVAVGVSGNPLLGAGMALSSISGMRTDVKHSGNLSGNAGAMGIKKPYIIITRPQTHIADDVEKFTGYPTNNTVTLSNVSGYTKVNYVHVEEIEGAFNSEKDEIERLLKEGVIIA